MKCFPLSIPFSSYCVVVLYIIVLVYLIFQANPLSSLVRSRQKVFDSVESYRKCAINRILELNDKQIWGRVLAIVNECSPRRFLAAKRYNNYDETKYFWKPNRNCTVVTLGIGEDTLAEETLKREHEDCKFIGADPVNFVNEQIYSKVGKYHQIAVGSKDMMNEAMVRFNGSYHKETTKFMSFPSFLKNVVKWKVIDSIWVDIEYAEYDILPFFYSNSQVEKDGILICQINVEIHAEQNFEQLVKAVEFYRRILIEGVYHFIEASELIGHKRLYLSRIGDERCM